MFYYEVISTTLHGICFQICGWIVCSSTCIRYFCSTFFLQRNTHTFFITPYSPDFVDHYSILTFCICYPLCIFYPVTVVTNISYCNVASITLITQRVRNFVTTQPKSIVLSTQINMQELTF